MPESGENDGQKDPSDSANLVSENGEEAGTLSPELRDLAGKALEYHDSALSESTRKAYQRGWEDFLSFCESHGLEAAPATEQAVALYLSDRAEDLATSTLSQRMAAIQHAHDERDLESPTRSKSVQNVMKGIRRESNRSPEQAPPILTEHVKEMVDSLPGNGESPSGTEARAAWLRGRRDRALILTGFAGAFRRSELATLRQEHIDSRPDGLLVTVPESKTDQEGKGQLVAIRRIEDSGYCPVKALRRWVAVASIEEGAIFRGVPRSGIISRDAITGRTVGNAVKQAAEAAGLPQADSYTGHSLRAGHITQASMEGAPDAAIQAQSRHESDRAFREYVRPQKLLENTSSAHLGL
ncbi:integrase [Salinibacter ruber]|uniref:tyrosine-type recombinase/integrase n=1 Tax=Salinibacter ruber TaxID=146919 RepID=UPI0013C309D7|nr:tyrosine-type recombinase/integrase [Salinibacter ruber]MCS3708216.1 integrase [Salinibacter ruber]